MLVYQRVHLPALLPEVQVVSVHMLRSHQAEEHAHLARPESYGWGSGSWIPRKLFFCTQIQIFGSKHPWYILYSNIQLYIEINIHCELWATGFIFSCTDWNEHVFDRCRNHKGAAPCPRAREPTAGPRCTFVGSDVERWFRIWSEEKVEKSKTIIIQNCWRSKGDKRRVKTC